MPGPLHGVRIVELAGIGPGPFAAMLLADLGADVVRVERVDAAKRDGPGGLELAVLNRSRRSIAVDLKSSEGTAVVLDLVERADALIEGFRPGVAERLGLGPDVCLARNPRLAFGRMTGWGQTGPMAKDAGHDINYIALSGALAAIGPDPDAAPVVPLNLVGDFGGGSLYLALGLVSAILEARGSGRGQVVDATMVDGAASLMTAFFGLHAAGQQRLERSSNILDGGAPFYAVYGTKDGRWVSVGALEPQFYALLIDLLGLADAPECADQHDRSAWPAMRATFERTFATRTRDEWDEILGGTDACYAPVLDLAEAPGHPHNVERGVFVDVGGTPQPGPAPRFSRTTPDPPTAPPAPGADTVEALAAWGVPPETIDRLREAGTIYQPPAA
ncbi:CaiB/BaiF CoA transferase family protein [Patulibacter minatonensis]|uniref:CaiB/BaiF CoA transferase family protein n=1 Tax=Patulibacter minatonensis TaxID=298163 RepID=UPI00047D6F74|nr:CaiB/BaiF CoA-transferase family protein [Patulibacter minatonensis]